MKKILLILLTTLFIDFVQTNAQDQHQYINYFYVKGEVCLPVTVKYRGGEFTIFNDGERHDGFIDYVEAYDCQGRQIVMPRTSQGYSSDPNKPIIREYVFQFLYSSGNNSYSNEGSSDNPEMNTKQRVVVDAGSAIGKGVKDIWGGTGYKAEGYPNFQFDFGVSRAYGEFARAKLCLGDYMGFTMYGGAGKDWWFNGENKDRISWHAGIGCYFVADTFDYEDSDFTIGLTYADSPLQKGGILMIDLTYSVFFGHSKRIGLFLGGGGGIGKVNELMKDYGYSWSEVKPNFIWDVNGGIAIKLWSE